MNFLNEVSKDLLKRFGNNLSNVTVVFPGKRARLFMNQYLATECDKPVWAPKYKTIDELYGELSDYRKADTIISVCEMYRIYSQLIPDAELLDEFYSWGEIILSDFDDIDKHMADADKLFRNIYDLQSISTDYLEDFQIKALSKFFKNFTAEQNTELKKRFLRLWEIMGEMYNTLKDNLKAKGLLYSGALYREVAERIKRNEIVSKEENQSTYIFVGFNILDECEETLFRYYQKQHQALFYWDYDKLYMQDDQWEAGYFIKQNLLKFPNALPEEMFDNLRKIKDITYIATSTSNAQCRYIPTWLDKQLTKKENETAIILADEHQLGSVLHCIPAKDPDNGKCPKSINVTMGFPLVDTPVFSFVNVLMSLYIEGFDAVTQTYRYTFFEHVRRHPYYQLVTDSSTYNETLFTPKLLDCKELLERITLAIDTISAHYANKKQLDVYDQLYTESLFQSHLIMTRFMQLVTPDQSGQSTLSVQAITLRKLIKQVLTNTSIPFHGEPAFGLQIMGLLETRNLDFRHLLLLNVTEGIFPKKSDDNSLIPHTLRESFGLTTIKHRISVFAYYFYRILSRAEHITLVYNENSSGTTVGEMSRFMRQLMAETDLPIKYVRLMPSNEQTPEKEPQTVIKTQEMVDELKKKYINKTSSKLSPTAINTYLACRLKYYYRYIAQIKPADNTEEGITPALFGTLFHDSAYLFYLRLMNKYNTKIITKEMLQSELDSKELRMPLYVKASLIVNYFNPIKEEEKKEEKLVSLAKSGIKGIQSFTENYFGHSENRNLLSGLTHIIYGVLCNYLTQLVTYDIMHTPFTLEGLEEDHYYKLKLSDKETVLTGGRIDRLERDSSGKLVVVDYKTGGQPKPIKNIDAIYEHKEHNAGYFLQTIIYALAVRQDFTEGRNAATGSTAATPDKEVSAMQQPVQPTLFYINRVGSPKTYNRSMTFGTDTKNEEITDIAPYAEEFEQKLRDTVSSIFDPTIPFDPTANESNCQYCDFKQICGKKTKEND